MSRIKRKLQIIAGVAGLALITGCTSIELGQKSAGADYLMLANFDSMLEVNDYDGSLFGYWNGFPDDITQKCEFNFFEPGMDGKGYCLKIIYKVNSPYIAYNGFWMLFEDLDFHEYGKLTFWARTESNKTSPGLFKVELKNEEKKVVQKAINNISTEWQKFEVDLKGNVFMEKWESIKEFVIVFAKDDVDAKEGVLFIDDIALER
ncbi:MAG: hypothetical protein ABII64_05560 [Elusimicrobiota bacterium]